MSKLGKAAPGRGLTRRRLTSLADGAPAAASRRLLVGFDGSDAARAALDHASELAHRNHGCLSVVLVLSDQMCMGWPLLATAPPLRDLQQDVIDDLRRSVDGLAEDISVVSVVRRGAVGPALAREAIRGRCDTIVIGRRCGVWSRLTGGVRRYLSRHAQARLIVVPAPSTGLLARGREGAAETLSGIAGSRVAGSPSLSRPQLG